MSTSNKSVLILGGAGFLGSVIARRFAFDHYRVTVVDGLFEKTGGNPENLVGIDPPVAFIHSSIEQVQDAEKLLAEQALIIDAMAWTSHVESFQDPMYDFRLNALSHLSLLMHLKGMAGLPIIYLGSRSQYGNPGLGVIDGSTPMIPEDIQGIHKVAGESYYRIFSRMLGLSVSVVRFPNCFGPGQRTSGKDIGLIGSFILEALSGRDIEVFGNQRKRSVVFAPDVAEVVFRLGASMKTGFNAYNIPGRILMIEDLAKSIIKLIGKGRVVSREIPEHIRTIDVGEAVLDGTSLLSVIGSIPESDLKYSLETTIDYFRRRIK